MVMLRAQNAAPRQRWTPPMTITPQVAPIANQAFETSQFFFLKHPNAMFSPHFVIFFTRLCSDAYTGLWGLWVTK